MELTFLLVNFNMKGLIEKCLKSIYAQGLKEGSYEILIADNSTDPNFTIDSGFINEHPSVSMHRLKENLGWIHALNCLLPKAKGKVVFIMHPDIEFLPDCINRLKDFLEKNPKVGVVSPDIVYPDRSQTKIRTKFPTINSEFNRMVNILSSIVLKKHFLTDEIFWDHKNDVETDMVMSVCLVIRKDILSAISPIPLTLKVYYSNDYLSLRTKRLGGKIFYLKDAVIIHYERFSSDKLYSVKQDNAYKKTAVPIVDRMERDKYSFLKFLYPFFYLLIMRLVNSFEYLIHVVASVKQHKRFLNEASRMYFRAIFSIWSTW